MASETKQRKGYTAPKGRPTVHRTATRSSRRLSSTTEWILAVVVFFAILGAIFYFGRNFNSPAGGQAELAPDTPVVLTEAIGFG